MGYSCLHSHNYEERLIFPQASPVSLNYNPPLFSDHSFLAKTPTTFQLKFLPPFYLKVGTFPRVEVITFWTLPNAKNYGLSFFSFSFAKSCLLNICSTAFHFNPILTLVC